MRGILILLLGTGLPGLSRASLPVPTVGPMPYARPSDTVNLLGQRESYQYYKMSRVTEVKDPAGNKTAYTFDALNRLTKNVHSR